MEEKQIPKKYRWLKIFVIYVLVMLFAYAIYLMLITQCMDSGCFGIRF